MVGAAAENLHHEEIERALEVVGFGHGIDVYYRHLYK